MEGNKKVLVVTYYWPPSAGSGVQRWLKFVKFLPQFGWEPFVFTPQNPSFALRDESLLKNIPAEAKVVKLPIWEPYEAFRKISALAGRENESSLDVVSAKKRSWFSRASSWIRGNLFVPDPRIFWIRPSVKFLRQFMADNHIGIIVTTGPPHSMHLIGYRLKKENPGLQWIADFRDPWSEWGLLDSLSVSPMVRRIHKRLEKKVLVNADTVTTITPFYVRHFERLGGRKVELLTNGYDEEDFKNFYPMRASKFTIRHIGIVNEKCNPVPFMEVLSSMISERPDLAKNLALEFIGEVNTSFKKYVSGNKALVEVTRFIPTVSHKELTAYYASSSMLLLILVGYKDAEGYMPGKLFEYIASGLPVLGVGPEKGDAASLINDTGAGVMLSESDKKGIEGFIEETYRRWQLALPVETGKIPLGNYSRKGVTKKLAELLNAHVKL